MAVRSADGAAAGGLLALMGLDEDDAPPPEWPGAAQKLARAGGARVPYLYEPHPDASDTALWQRLLAAAFLCDGEHAAGLYGALHGVRCLGARLVRRENGRYRVVAPEAGYLGDWSADAVQWLAPHRTVLTALLRELEAPPVVRAGTEE